MNGGRTCTGWALPPCILQALDAGWADAGAISFTVNGVAIEIRAGGRWRCERAVRADTVELLDLFLPWVAAPGRLAMAQLGQSLDGRIATRAVPRTTSTAWRRVPICIPARARGCGGGGRRHPGSMRTSPQLTVRHVSGRSPVRVVLDPRGRVRADAKLFHDGAAPRPCTWWASTWRRFARPGAERVVRVGLPVAADGFEPDVVLEWLAQSGCRRVL